MYSHLRHGAYMRKYGYMRQRIVGAVISTLIAMPLAANAQSVISTNSSVSASALSSQAQSLLQQIAQLQSQLSAMGVSASNTQGASNTTAGTAASACPQFSRSLRYGSSGDDVTALQTYLAQDASVYPEAIVSGYYGTATQAAVGRWQVKNGILSGGTLGVGGYGVVGPRTSAAMSLMCTQSSGGGQQATSQVGGYIQVTPISGSTPLATTIQAFVNTVNNCNPITYTLDFGDGSALQQIPTNGSCTQVTQTYQHTYTIGGTYQVVLSAGNHRTTASVIVNGPSTVQQQTTGQTTVLPTDSARASISSGVAPLSVVFSGTISGTTGVGCQGTCNETLSYGDGAVGLVPIPPQGTWQSYTLPHVYQNAGQYTATLLSPLGTLLSSMSITVGAAAATSTTSGSYGIVSVGAASASNANTVNIVVSVPSCASYQVNWGDGATSGVSTGSCTTGGTQISQSHTYASIGSYTITLYDGSSNKQTSSSYTVQ